MERDIVYSIINTDLAEIILAGDEAGLRYLHLNTEDAGTRFSPGDGWSRRDDFFYEIKIQLEEYFAGERRQFHVKTSPEGTIFQKTVWAELEKIPYGQTDTYGGIASAIGKPKAARAAGAAIGRNPIPIIIPCHRVIGSTGELTGFAYGLKLKRHLLELEGIM